MDFKMSVKMYIRHKVADFDRWKLVFEEVEPLRKQSGSTGSHVFRSNSDPNEVLVISNWDTKEQGIKYGESPELKSAMVRAGVVSSPEISFAE